MSQLTPGSRGVGGDVRCLIDHLPIGVVDALDEIRLVAHPVIWEHGVSGCQVPELALESAEVNGRHLGDVRDAGLARQLPYGIHPRQVAHSRAHRVARLNQAFLGAQGSLVQPVGIGRIPGTRSVDFAGAEGRIINSGSRQKTTLKAAA